MLTTLLLSLTAAAAVPPAPAEKRAKCGRPDVTLVRPSDGRLYRLDRLPPGRLEYTVRRQMDGCPIPAVLRENVGGNRR